MILATLVCILAILPLLLNYFKKWKMSYWQRRGLITLESDKIHLSRSANHKKHFTEQLVETYQEVKSKGLKHCGRYQLLQPVYLPVDLELIKSILQKDFVHFSSHGMNVNEKVDPLTGNLFNLDGEKWRNLRAKLTPTFTSGKMKMMFQTLVDSTVPLVDVLNENAKTGEATDIREILARYTTDVIGSCAFGVECNSLKDPNSEFRRQGKKSLDQHRRGKLMMLIMNLIPIPILYKLGFSFDDKEVEKFFIDLVKNTVEYREKNNVNRKDFMHLLIQLKNTGKVSDDDSFVVDNSETSGHIGLTINEMAAQCSVFFIAGFETSSTTMTFALCELAQNQDIQQKLREEIEEVLKKHDYKITYDAIMEMEYMEKVINETLRKHPPIPMMMRVCTKEYPVPGTDVVIERGTKVDIPFFAIHRDPEFYPEPEKFDPERFNEENKAKRPAFAFLPFGEGPRLCIGLRFGKLQSKVGLVTILRNFKVTLNEKTKTPIRYGPSFISSIDGGLWLTLTKL